MCREEESVGAEFHHWLARLLAPDEGVGEDVIQIALDGSFRDGYISYGGAAAPQASWIMLDRLWRRKLQENGLTYLRMTEAMNFHGEFLRKRQEWGSDASRLRDSLLMEFATIARGLHFRGLGFAVHVDGFPEQKMALHKRQCFQRVVISLLDSITAGNVGLICDTEQDAADYFRRWLDNLKQNEKTGARRIVALCFVDSRTIYAIQYADMVAYLIREEAERGERNPTVPVNPLLPVVLEIDNQNTGYMLDGRDLPDGAGNT